MSEITFRSDVSVELIDSMGSEERIVQAARASTKGAEAKEAVANGLVRTLVEEGHTVPLEHCVFTFKIEAPLFVVNQMVKHRISSISAHSARYSEMRPQFYVPADARPCAQTGKPMEYNYFHSERTTEEAQTQLVEVANYAWDSYTYMLGEGVAKEVARSVLPVSMYTTIFMTVNLNSLLNIIKLRTDRYGSHPQEEIRWVGEAMRDVVVEKFPTVGAML